ncbi:bifunctional UDP-N-acetylglucosamine diphosphorylase/glucosamine-1-phosphate N-acetyltransferase GlmU [Mycetocola reblochoni]|uniref:Bifunctional protein GlmU n=1 Tax=Mycetocola reblochoni TaxID=331618 RepID=A0A3L6ZJQ4_9MICO|nr:bifunctional UDP-N-acetylglucosamine diphosphorylase/glucosamine-1-phosphate N-acetyltransferase GlmU [Mycetocola reblochoni]RLP68224.1 bifunctional UDP-N-acetylglucosamine diphosphorylase/glucosamine-1-phosphate N-acetyltransferase GlmU [Mycetocola reblochoni]
MSDSNLAVIVLAAGQGTRMRSATPKLLHPLAGAPVLSHVLATVSALSAGHLLVVVRHERDRIAALVAEDAPGSVIVDQDEVPGTGRAVEQAVDALPGDFDGDVLVVNGDVPLLDPATLERLIERHRSSGAAASLLSAILDDATGYGRIIRGEAERVQRIVEHKDATAEERRVAEINAGVYIFRVAALRAELPRLGTDNAQSEKYVTDVIQALTERGEMVGAHAAEEAWRLEGINDRVQLADAAARLNAEIIRFWQREGVTVQDPATTWIDRDVSLAPDVTVLPGTQILRASVVATGAVIGPDTTLNACEVGENAVVRRSDATLAVIGADTTVGPFAYLRPGTQLADEGTIGTFSETKNAIIGRGSKLAHFNYVGDAELGEGVNLGAGSITANYDGVDKHRTEIGSHSRVASHTVFVAPVRMGDGAYTGAGTVVRKDIPAGALAINVAPQRNMEGWVATHRPGTAADEAAQSASSDR